MNQLTCLLSRGRTKLLHMLLYVLFNRKQSVNHNSVSFETYRLSTKQKDVLNTVFSSYCTANMICFKEGLQLVRMNGRSSMTGQGTTLHQVTNSEIH